VGNAHEMHSNAYNSQILAGTYRHTLDEKKRVTIPARWRGVGEEKTEFFAILANEDGDLAIHLTPAAELGRIREEIQADQNLNPKEQSLALRRLFSAAFPCPLDKQGRVVLPVNFCRKLNLETEAVLCGVGSRIEIRSPQAWDELMPDDDEALYAVAKALGICTPKPRC
jgi:MraZ protein